jgi:hypothetical protein
MSERFEVQARLLRRDGGVVVRDEVRNTRADNLDDAIRAAARDTADGFTVWIYRVVKGAGISPTYERVRTSRPPAG